MESNIKCKNHKNDYEFYCFDDKEFFCPLCFNLHKKHNIEIKIDLEKKEKLLKILRTSDKTKLLDQYNSYSEKLKQLQDLIITEIERNHVATEALKKDLSDFDDKVGCIYDLSYDQYEKLDNFQLNEFYSGKFFTEIESILKIQITRNKSFIPNENGIKWLQKEVNVHSLSNHYLDYHPDIMLEKKNGSYYLSNGRNNHWIIFDFNAEIYIQKFKFTVSNFECSIKDFKVSVSNNNEEWKSVGEFQAKKYSECPDFQEHTLNCHGRYLKLDLINNWGLQGGNYILITRMLFFGGPI